MFTLTSLTRLERRGSSCSDVTSGIDFDNGDWVVWFAKGVRFVTIGYVFHEEWSNWNDKTCMAKDCQPQVATILFHAHLSLLLSTTLKEDIEIYFHNAFIKVRHNFSEIFWEFWQKLLPWQHFHFILHFPLFALFKNDSICYNCKTFSYISFKIGVY